MYFFRHSLNRKGDKLVYSLPLVYYVVTALVTGVMLVALLALMKKPDFVWWSFAVFALFIVLTEDRWTVDPARRVIRHRYGLLPIARSFELEWDRISSVSFVDERFRPDPPPEGERERMIAGLARKHRAGWVTLSFQLNDGIEYTFLSFPEGHKPAVRAAGKEIAEAMGKPYYEVVSSGE